LYRQILIPDSSTGRLGILELRALICLTQAYEFGQNLLVRALVAKFWKEPIREKLILGTELHDKFYCRILPI
jgi:uncharacterized protein (DUF2126 family)